MINSVKVTDIYPEFMLYMDKSSISKFTKTFTNSAKQLKESTKEITYFSTISSSKDLPRSIFSKYISDLLISGIVKSKKSQKVTDNSSTKTQINLFTTKFSEINNFAKSLDETMLNPMKLKYFADLKGVKYKDFLKVIIQSNEICKGIKKHGITNKKEQKFYWMMKGDGSNYNSIERLELIIKQLNDIKNDQNKGLNEAIKIAILLFPMAQNSSILAMLTKENKELVEIALKRIQSKSKNEKIEKELKLKKETLYTKKNIGENIKYENFCNNYPLKNIFTKDRKIIKSLKKTQTNSLVPVLSWFKALELESTETNYTKKILHRVGEILDVLVQIYKNSNYLPTLNEIKKLNELGKRKVENFSSSRISNETNIFSNKNATVKLGQ